MRGMLASSKKKPVHRESHSTRARSLVDRALRFDQPPQLDINTGREPEHWPGRVEELNTDIDM